MRGSARRYCAPACGGVEPLRAAQNASTALVGTDPARPHAGRLGRGWPRPTRGLGASLPPTGPNEAETR